MSQEALETVEGAALATELVEMLEAELVRFQHRVAFDQGIELDRARAAMVLLSKLVGSGVKWTARPDSDPTRIYEVFNSMLPKHPAIASILKKELAAFFVATTDVAVAEDTARTSASILRRAGADPSLWWWAASYTDPDRCWAACGDDADRSIQFALAFGVPVERVAQAFAGALAWLAPRVKTRYPPHRTALVAALAGIAGTGTLEGSGAITKLAFELRYKDQQATDPLTELSTHAFQLVEMLLAAKDRPDVERFGALASRVDRMFTARGLQLAAMLRKDLEDLVNEVLASARRESE